MSFSSQYAHASPTSAPRFNPGPQPANSYAGATTTQPKAPVSSVSTASPVSHDELARIFNNALVATRAAGKDDGSTDLKGLVQSPAFRAILNATRLLAAQEGLSERQAAEEIINTFRRVDQLWAQYLYKEGMDALFRPKC